MRQIKINSFINNNRNKNCRQDNKIGTKSCISGNTEAALKNNATLRNKSDIESNRNKLATKAAIRTKKQQERQAKTI